MVDSWFSANSSRTKRRTRLDLPASIRADRPVDRRRTSSALAERHDLDRRGRLACRCAMSEASHSSRADARADMVGSAIAGGQASSLRRFRAQPACCRQMTGGGRVVRGATRGVAAGRSGAFPTLASKWTASLHDLGEAAQLAGRERPSRTVEASPKLFANSCAALAETRRLTKRPRATRPTALPSLEPFTSAAASALASRTVQRQHVAPQLVRQPLRSGTAERRPSAGPLR